MMRVLLAGGGGFIGSHLADRMIARGDVVVVIDSFIRGRPGNVAHLRDHARFELVEHDIVDELPSLGEFDAVLNLASPASPDDFIRQPLAILDVGSTGNRRLLELAACQGARFLLASTSEVYGDPAVHPQTEDYLGNVDPIGPRSCYDEAKRFAEATTMAYQRYRGTDVRIARIFNTYGSRMAPGDGRVVNTFIAQALRGEPVTVYGDGSQTRSFCHVEDQVSGLLALLASRHEGPVNLGNPEEISIVDLAHLIIELVGSESDVRLLPLPFERTGDPVRRCPDIGLARSELGWEPLVSLQDGLASMIGYYKASEDLG